MSLTVAVLMDPIESIHIEKDSTFAMLLEAQRRGHALALPRRRATWPCATATPWARCAAEHVRDDPTRLVHAGRRAAGATCAKSMWSWRARIRRSTRSSSTTPWCWSWRSAPACWWSTIRAALRDANEKLFALHFPQCIPPTLVARDAAEIKALRRRARRSGAETARRHGRPLDLPQRSRRSESQCRFWKRSPTNGRNFTVAQKYLAGDQRRRQAHPAGRRRAGCRTRWRACRKATISAATSPRGGKGVGLPLTERERWIAAQVGARAAPARHAFRRAGRDRRLADRDQCRPRRPASANSMRNSA